MLGVAANNRTGPKHLGFTKFDVFVYKTVGFPFPFD